MRFIPGVSVLFLAGIFLYSGIDKATHYEGFVNTMASYSIFPSSWAGFLSPVWILTELWVGVCLLWPRWRTRAALASVFVLSVSTLLLVSSRSALPGSLCGCWFTITLPKSSTLFLTQTLILLGLALSVWQPFRKGFRGLSRVEMQSRQS
ncbi:MAG: DoxX family membrane protein [Deltaproteobacteria bacterium]|nr:DoxX family membrane protein [Deltaproteobacteria bacterium]